MSVINKTRELFANNMVYFRQKNNWSQEQLAEKLNSSTTYISDIENGKRKSSLDYINKVSEIFNIEPHELLKKRNTITKRRVNKK